MPPVSKSSPENRRPLGLLFSNNLNYRCPPVSRSSTESSSPKSCYFPITLITMIIPCVVTFLKNSIFDNFLSHFVWEKLILRVSIFWTNKTIFSFFLKSSIFENFFKYFNPFCIGKNFDPFFMGRN